MQDPQETIAFYEEIKRQHETDVANLLSGLTRMQERQNGAYIDQTAARIVELELRIAKLKSVIATFRETAPANDN